AVKKADGSTETLTFANVIIATGSSVRLVPGTALSENVVTYEKQILTRELPGSIIIAGAGAIGMEFAYVLKNYGVDVTIVEFLPRALPNEDAEVSKEIEKQYKKLGVKILTGTKVESITDSGSQVTVKVSKDGQESELVADKVLQAIGFAPNVQGFGLENTGVALTDRGAIAIDERMRTNVPHIYAIGAETLELGDYRMMPRATFCQPQVASFGLTEEQARAEGYDVKVAKFPFTANGKAHGLADPTGFVKLIADAKYGELIGGHLIGPDVSELLPELTLAQKWDLTVNELTRNVHTHPTLSEALQEATPQVTSPTDIPAVGTPGFDGDFITPDGLACSVGGDRSVDCAGALPGVQPGVVRVRMGAGTGQPAGFYRVLDTHPRVTGAQRLEVGRKVAKYGVACRAESGPITICDNGKQSLTIGSGKTVLGDRGLVLPDGVPRPYDFVVSEVEYDGHGPKGIERMFTVASGLR
ncbi:Dihydrolipoyl dehydrogenase, partial [Aduncisulcus paluster]